MTRVFLPILVVLGCIVALSMCHPQRDYSKPQASSFGSPFAPAGLGESAFASFSKPKDKKNMPPGPDNPGAVIANARNTGMGATNANALSNAGGDVLANSLQQQPQY